MMARGIAIAVAMLLAGAAPAERTVPHPGGGPALVIPAGSPVKFRGFDKGGGARFSGRFVLSGTFIWDQDDGHRGDYAVEWLSEEARQETLSALRIGPADF